MLRGGLKPTLWVLLQALSKYETCVTGRMILHASALLVAHPFVKARRLKRVRREEHQLAAFQRCVLLGCVEESGSKPTASYRCVNPKVRHIATPAPCVAADSRANDVRLVAMRRRERFAVDVSRRVRVELVDALGQERVSLGRLAASKTMELGFMTPTCT